ncbi:DAK2 domain fusion protein YloV [Bellilinea caldifistulae]|uniref:DAK2 domain-containing protein n=1 Tax=Bellilinea caldifistulae TaxID=360411 RepID=UPI0007843B7C|nr:DAK2 domain-containing protein [Bellilinea caldifistulae]GAP10691.1 DAK2 domain fusion protein YloV [Bellilinea caldifistulae]
MIDDVNRTTLPQAKEIAQAGKLDGIGLKRLVEAGTLWLKANQQLVNSLNVFPVPDGDTGTNMLLTMQAAYNEILHSDERNVGKVAHAIAQGALMGARGNSGVILSQLWRGFARALDNFEEVDGEILIKALVEAKNTAYKGVVRPVEGTILTVAKDIATAIESFKGKPLSMEWLEKIVFEADLSVQKTPELLPILKQAGVVDSGGKGLFIILEGMLRYLKGQSLETPTTSIQPITAMNLEETMEEIEPGQDFEVVVDFRPHQPLDLDRFYEHLSQMGTSIQVGEGDGMYRMHIHVPTEKRYEPIEYTMSLGTITKVAIENLLAQMEEKKNSRPSIEFPPCEPGKIAVVAVSPGLGLSRIFASLGVNAIVEGGQTMNPSTEEILRAFENLPTDQIIILPNNKNIILAAQNAASLSVKNVKVIPTKTIPQGLNVMLRFDPDGNLEDIASEMEEAINEVESGEITTATRSVEINGVKVEEGQVIALLNGQLVASASHLEEACFELLKAAKSEERERITLFYGQNISVDEVHQLAEKIQEKYPDHEMEIHEGGQPHYQLIISIE